MVFEEPEWLQEAMKKYKRKLHHVKLTKQIREIEKDVGDACAYAQARLENLTVKIKKVLDREGVYSDWHPSYLAYAFALHKSQMELEYMVDLKREHQILRQRWEARGLNPTVLDKIDDVVIFRG